MARSSRTTASATSSHIGHWTWLNNPHPCDSANTPKPTALVGMTIRTASASSTVIPRLFSQRKDRETDRFRLGKTASQKAKAANTLREIPRRISGSMLAILSIMATQLASHCSAYHAVSLHSITVFECPRWIDNRGPQIENRSVMWSRCWGLFLSLLAGIIVAQAGRQVQIIDTPNRGIAPDADIDQTGVIHLAYVSDEDVYYVKSADDGKSFSTALRVNCEPKSAQRRHVSRSRSRRGQGRLGSRHLV